MGTCTPGGSPSLLMCALIRKSEPPLSILPIKQSLLTCCPGSLKSYNMWSDARFPAAAPTLADFLN
jgi:hypothetical protein